ncbi:MAG: aldehyde ferredoxin oxidoreductase N-terminal domain-containing protein, partial [Caldilineaceae bacterium]
MRTYRDIRLDTQQMSLRELHGEEILKAGRYLIARTLVEMNVAPVDPLGPENPLIFSAGPFAGTSFSNANRTSVGCKSPLTGGVKEANGGGNFAYAMGQLQIAGFTLHGIAPEWTVLYFQRDGSLRFDSAAELMGLGNYAAAEQSYARYGKKVALALCGPVGEYQGLLAGIA